MGKLSYYFGTEVLSIDNGVCLNQRKYCLEPLHEFGILGSKPSLTPLEANFVPNSDSDDNKDPCLENITEFQKLVGKLIYLTITRPDISYYVQILSQFMHKPHKLT